jgi:exopolyphosphatase / guanosine-5'-triphosphate,3'-diphosphate pyrophosphatase
VRDHDRVRELLGREPQGSYEVVVRDGAGDPVVIRNAPLLDDGTPMPTRFWLVGAAVKTAIDRLEASGGVRQAETEVPAGELAAAHVAYAAERDAAMPPSWSGPHPSGGVGGTRQGVKCLHAHYAWYAAGGPDPVGRWVAEQLGWAEPEPLESRPSAAIDCGTNSTRLLVARPGGPTLERLMRITRLGQDVDRTRRLAPEAIERTLEVLREYRSVMDRFGVGPARMTATSAARDAENRGEFFDAAEAVVGVRPELLGGDEEGQLSFSGATAELDPSSGPWLVVDIGGGSTELVAGPDAKGGLRGVRSLDVGCVRLSERFIDEDPPSAASVAAARAFVDGLLDEAISATPELLGTGTMVGLAGTVASLAAIDQELTGYARERVHHYELRRDRVEVMLERLAGTDSAGRRAMPGVEPGRADVIVGGTIVLAAVMDRFGFDGCLTSEADILDGLVASTGDNRLGPSGLPTV